MYVYGPVPSRRLGRSLGVSPIPSKTCSYSCVYCQLGRTNHLQVKRESFFSKQDIFAEIIMHCQTAMPDYITFVGDGEPTLCRDLGWLIRHTKINLRIPTAVITNSSLLYRKDVRQDLDKADIIIASLDAGDERLYNIINRPHAGIDFHTMLEGLSEFSREFTGKLWLEIMLVKGLNDSPEELSKIKNVIEKIKSDRVYLLTPTRPPAESWVTPPDPENLLKAQEILKDVIPIVDYEIGDIELEDFNNAAQSIIEIGSRHPMRREQVQQIEKYFDEKGTIDKLIKDGKLVEYKYNGIEYLLPYKISPHFYIQGISKSINELNTKEGK